MTRWTVEIEVWPHSTGRGRDPDDKAAGGRFQSCEVVGETLDDALRGGNLFRAGICTNPAVWQTRVRKIEMS